jgi:hypothetical protein
LSTLYTLFSSLPPTCRGCDILLHPQDTCLHVQIYSTTHDHPYPDWSHAIFATP